MTIPLQSAIKACELSIHLAQSTPNRDQNYINKVSRLLMEANFAEVIGVTVFSLPYDEFKLIGKALMEIEKGN